MENLTSGSGLSQQAVRPQDLRVSKCLDPARGRFRSAASRSSSVKPVVSTGSPILHVDHHRAAQTSCPSASPRGRPTRPPGTIGACALMAMMNPPFLNGKISDGPAARALGEDQERIARSNRRGGPIDRRHRRFPAVALDRDESTLDHHRPEHRQLLQLGLEQDVQALDAAPGTAPADRRCFRGWSRTPTARCFGARLAARHAITDAGAVTARVRRRGGRGNTAPAWRSENRHDSDQQPIGPAIRT